MSEPMLKYRTRFTSSMDNRLWERFQTFAEQSRIPKSRLIDEAIEDLLKKGSITKPVGFGIAVIGSAAGIE